MLRLVLEEPGELDFYFSEDDDEYDMVVDAFSDRLQDLFEITEADDSKK
jgi:hypothetical protein